VEGTTNALNNLEEHNKLVCHELYHWFVLRYAMFIAAGEAQYRDDRKDHGHCTNQFKLGTQN